MQALSILVTGASGTIGHRLVPKLLQQGHRVVASTRHPGLSKGRENCVSGDLHDPVTRRNALNSLVRNGPERCAVIHLAGLSSVGAATASREKAFDSNALLVHRLLETCVEVGVTHFLLASTGLVYASRSLDALHEDSPVDPRTVYAGTKLAAEMIVRGYATECGLRCDIFRMSNVFGPDSPESTVVGRILKQLRNGEPVAVASRDPVRDFIYVDDVADAICALLKNRSSAQIRITNVSSGIGVSVGALADTAEAVVRGATPSEAKPPVTTDGLILSNRFLREQTDWTPKFSLADGLQACLS